MEVDGRKVELMEELVDGSDVFLRLGGQGQEAAIEWSPQYCQGLGSATEFEPHE